MATGDLPTSCPDIYGDGRIPETMGFMQSPPKYLQIVASGSGDDVDFTNVSRSLRFSTTGDYVVVALGDADSTGKTLKNVQAGETVVGRFTRVRSGPTGWNVAVQW